jgi:DNA-binding transcriptional ArsR family regulator
MKERQRAVAASKSATHSARGHFAGGGSEELRRFKAQLFQGLAHPTRIAIVELLRHGELSAGQLIEQLGLEQANASQHLAVLRSKQIVVNRKEGNQVFYSLRDPVLIEVLDILKRYFYSQLSQTMSMLKEIEVPSHAAKK